MEIRPNRVKKKLAAGEIAYVGSGFTHPDDIDVFGDVIGTITDPNGAALDSVIISSGCVYLTR